MNKNYHLFKQQIAELKPQIINGIVTSAFTVRKNELILQILKEDSEKHLRLGLSGNEPYILLSPAQNYKAPSLNLFSEIKDVQLNDIIIIPFNKFIIFKFDNISAHATFYGPNPNIVLVDSGNNVIATFKNQEALSSDIPSENEVYLNIEIIEKIINDLPDRLVLDFLKEACPGFNRKMLNDLLYQLKLDSNSRFKDIKLVDEFFNKILSFKQSLRSGKCYLFKKDGILHNIRLYKTTDDENLFEIEEFDSINQAWTIFLNEKKNSTSFEKTFKIVSYAINKRKRQLETALQKITEAENIEERKKEADLKGNLILTNKHKIPRAIHYIELINVFSDKQELIKIKLNPKKTAVENAQYYFEKYKDMSEKRHVIKLKKDTYYQELIELKNLEEQLKADNRKNIDKLYEKLVGMNLIQTVKGKPATLESLKYSFRRLIIENTWDVYIGKNNLNNDLLTFTFANKWDIWLHAQGVSGSHVIIRVPGKNITVPPFVIEKAAQIAAANSKAKHSSTVPVIYTQAKYVSRIRKAQPGTVSIKNEKTIFVEPITTNL